MHHTTYEYLKPTDEQVARMGRVRAAARRFGEALERELPDGADKDHVIRNHRETAMWANVAITRHADGTPRDDPAVTPKEPPPGPPIDRRIYDHKIDPLA